MYGLRGRFVSGPQLRDTRASGGHPPRKLRHARSKTAARTDPEPHLAAVRGKYSRKSRIRLPFAPPSETLPP